MVRSISRGSNASNLTHDHAKKRAQMDPNQKTIEQPTDTEDNQNNYESACEFDHVGVSPDI